MGWLHIHRWQFWKATNEKKMKLTDNPVEDYYDWVFFEFVCSCGAWKRKEMRQP